MKALWNVSLRGLQSLAYLENASHHSSHGFQKMPGSPLSMRNNAFASVMAPGGCQGCLPGKSVAAACPMLRAAPRFSLPGHVRLAAAARCHSRYSLRPCVRQALRALACSCQITEASQISRGALNSETSPVSSALMM